MSGLQTQLLQKNKGFHPKQIKPKWKNVFQTWKRNMTANSQSLDKLIIMWLIMSD